MVRTLCYTQHTAACLDRCRTNALPRILLPVGCNSTDYAVALHLPQAGRFFAGCGCPLHTVLPGLVFPGTRRRSMPDSTPDYTLQQQRLPLPGPA